MSARLAGGQICAYAEDFGARCVVLLHHGHKSMIRELQVGLDLVGEGKGFG